MLKKFLIYFVGNVAAKAIVFLLLPIYTAYFSPEEYGTIDVIVVTLTTIISMAFMEIWQAVLRFMYEEKEIIKKYAVFSNGIILIIPMSILYLISILVMSLFIPYEYYPLVVIYGFTLLLLNLYQFFSRGIQLNNAFVISGLISNILEVVFNLIFVIIFRLGVMSILISASLAKIISVIYLEYHTKALARFDRNVISLKKMNQMIRYTFPLAINAVAFWGMGNINRIVSYRYIGAESNGYLAVVNKFTGIVSIFIMVFTLAWQEDALEKSMEADRNKHYSNMLSKFYLILATGTACVLLSTKIMFPWFVNSSYSAAMEIIPLSFVATYAAGVSSFLGPLFGVEKKTNIIFYSTIIGAVVNIVLLIKLLPTMGIFAIPISLCIGFGVNSVSRYLWLKKLIGIKTNIMSLTGSLLILGTSALIAQFTEGIKASILGLVIYGILFLIIFHKDLQNFIGGRIRKNET